MPASWDRRDDRRHRDQVDNTGTHPLLEKLRRGVPEGVLDMLSLPGLKPERVNILHRELGITDLDTLEAAVRKAVPAESSNRNDRIRNPNSLIAAAICSMTGHFLLGLRAYSTRRSMGHCSTLSAVSFIEKAFELGCNALWAASSSRVHA